MMIGVIEYTGDCSKHFMYVSVYTFIYIQARLIPITCLWDKQYYSQLGKRGTNWLSNLPEVKNASEQHSQDVNTGYLAPHALSYSASRMDSN